MKRSRTIVLLSHCILNANAKVQGLASYRGAIEHVLLPILQSGAGIIQLPCPEQSFLGAKRWGMTREQYDTPSYRQHCQALLTSTIQELKDYVHSDYRILELIGIDGSPSCGVNRTCVGYTGGEWCKAGEQQKNLREIPGKGIFIQVLEEMLVQNGISIPFKAIDEKDLSVS